MFIYIYQLLKHPTTEVIPDRIIPFNWSSGAQVANPPSPHHQLNGHVNL